MENKEVIEFLVNAILFFIVYKLGQFSVHLKNTRAEIEERNTKTSITSFNKIVTVEEINGIYLAYDGDDFLGQANSPEELGKVLANKYKTKYLAAKVQMRVSN